MCSQWGRHSSRNLFVSTFSPRGDFAVLTHKETTQGHKRQVHTGLELLLLGHLTLASGCDITKPFSSSAKGCPWEGRTYPILTCGRPSYPSQRWCFLFRVGPPTSINPNSENLSQREVQVCVSVVIVEPTKLLVKISYRKESIALLRH